MGEDKLFGGYNVGGRGVYFQRTFKLTSHKRVTVAFRAYIVDSWDNEYYRLYADNKLVFNKRYWYNDRNR